MWGTFEGLARSVPEYASVDVAFEACMGAPTSSGRIEVMMFATRFGSVILGYVAAREALRVTHQALKDARLPTGTILDDVTRELIDLDEWRAESESYRSEEVGLAYDALTLNGATAVLAASAALELLVTELATLPGRPSFRAKVASLTSASEATGLVTEVVRRRNHLAHSLDGSYWGDRIELSDQDVAACLADIGGIADRIDDELV